MGTPVTALTRRRHHLRSRAPLIVALLILLAGTIAAGTQFGPLAGRSGVGAQEAETRTVELDEGWNLVGWTGPETPFLDAIAEIIEQAAAAAAFDAAAQSFRTWNASAPPVLQTLVTLLQGEAVWLRVTAPVAWVQPVVADPGPLGLRRGFNLVTWTGPSGLEAAQSFAGNATTLNAAFAFDAIAETFSSYGPSRPGFLNDLTPLVYGDGFWALMDGAASWSQPAAPAPAAVSLPDGSVTLEIPRGALPPGVDASDITITDSPDGPRPVVEGADFLLAVQLEPSGLTFATPVLLHARVRLDPGAMPIPVLLSAERGVEFVPGATIAPDGDDPAGVIVTVPITHFSWETLYEAIPVVSMFEETARPLGEVTVGEIFTMRVTFIRLADFELDLTITAPDEFLFLDDDVSPAVTKQMIQVRAASTTGLPWSVRLLRHAEVVTGAASWLGGLDEFQVILPDDTANWSEFWRCEALGPLTLELSEAYVLNPVAVTVLSFVEDRLDAGSSFTRIGVAGGRLPMMQVSGTCVAPPGFFGFLSAGSDGVVDPDEEIQDEPPIGEWVEILVADPTTPLADVTRFPIAVTVEVNGARQQTLLIEDPVADCANPTVCSGHLEAIEAMPGDTVTITARDATGAVIAFQSTTVPG